RGVHPGVKAQYFGVPSAVCADDDGAAVGRVAVAGDPSALFQAVEDSGHRGGMQAGASGEGARGEGTVATDKVEAIEIDVLEFEVRADVMVEHGQLDAQLAQRILDRELQLFSIRRCVLSR